MEKARYLVVFSVIAALLIMLTTSQPVNAQSGTLYDKLQAGTYVGEISFEADSVSTMNQDKVSDYSVWSFYQYEGTIKIVVSKNGGSTGKPGMSIQIDFHNFPGYWLRDNSVTDSGVTCKSMWYASGLFSVAKSKAFNVLSNLNKNFVLPITFTQKNPDLAKYTTTCPQYSPPASEEEANAKDQLKSFTAWFDLIELIPTEGSDAYIAGDCDFHAKGAINASVWNKPQQVNGVSYKVSDLKCHWAAYNEKNSRWILKVK